MDDRPWMYLFVGTIVLGVTVTSGIYSGRFIGERKLGTAVCKKLGGTFSRLDDKPVCLNPAGGVLKFYD